jgi:MoaA/NifB/PqqE/SkfB family radical SAM enzyme
MASLETLAEILRRVEAKVDTINGSVARVTDRVAQLEQKEAVFKSQLSIMKWLTGSVILPVLAFVIVKAYDLAFRYLSR